MYLIRLQRFAFKHKPQTFSRVYLITFETARLPFKTARLPLEGECYRSANAAAIWGVTAKFLEITYFIYKLYVPFTFKSVKINPQMWYFESLKCVISHAKTLTFPTANAPF